MGESMELTQEEVKRIFKYDRKTGALVRRFSVGKAVAGTHSTCKDRDGYIVIGINKKLYRAHRVVWLYFHGQWPNNDCDHINRIKDDNRIQNLRDITRSQNKQNQLVTRVSKSGIKGVCWVAKIGRWQAEITHQGKSYILGRFVDIEDAAKAYKAAAKKFHEFNPSAKGKY